MEPFLASVRDMQCQLEKLSGVTATVIHQQAGTARFNVAGKGWRAALAVRSCDVGIGTCLSVTSLVPNEAVRGLVEAWDGLMLSGGR